MTYWEYKTLKIYNLNEVPRLLEETLDAYGLEGWELVAVTGNNTHLAFFKRVRKGGK